MPALKNNSFKPTLQVLEDRFMPSASPWGGPNHGQQQQALLQNQITALADAAQIRQQAQTTLAAQMSPVNQNVPMHHGVEMSMPANIVVPKTWTLCQTLNYLRVSQFGVTCRLLSACRVTPKERGIRCFLSSRSFRPPFRPATRASSEVKR
jgi:hypothetical protein